MDILAEKGMNNIKLSVQGVEQYFDGKVILDKVSFDVYEGEFLSILGPSGCGKTTLLRILIGLQKMDKGKLVKDGRDITDIDASQRGMGIVFQNYALFENMTVLENVEYAMKIKKENKSKEARKNLRRKVLELLEDMQLSEHINKRPSELSGGQQQRVAIARTLIMKPDILLFDEPMSALDVATRLALRKVIKGVQENYGTTIIYITHDQEEAFAMSDRIAVMREAKIVQIDLPENIIKQPADAYVKEFVSENIQKKVNALGRYLER